MSLSAVLPGLREVRAPLIAGYLYLLLIWLQWGDRLEEGQDEGAIGKLVELGHALPTAVTLAAASVAAYLLGSLLDSVRARIAELLDVITDGKFRLSTPGRERLKDLLDERETRARERLAEAGLALDHPTLRPVPTPVDISRETDDVRDSLVGEQPDRLAEVDRHRSETELRAALMVPLALLSLILVRDHGQAWWLGVGAAVGLAIQAMTRMRRYNESVADALIRDVRYARKPPATSPSLTAFERSVDESIAAVGEARELMQLIARGDEKGVEAQAALYRLIQRESDRAARRPSLRGSR